MSGTHVAFFRNLNLGQGVSPTRTVLLEAFVSLGAPEAWSFQVNGTVVFDPGDAEAHVLAERVVARLTPICGYADAVLVRSLAELRALDLAAGDEVAYYDAPTPFPEPLPWTSPRGDLRIVHADGRLAVAVNREAGRSAATPTLERLLGVPVTSRGTGTVERLLRKAGS